MLGEPLFVQVFFGPGGVAQCLRDRSDLSVQVRLQGSEFAWRGKVQCAEAGPKRLTQALCLLIGLLQGFSKLVKPPGFFRKILL